MRVTNQLFYQNFANDHKKMYSDINRVTTQISSGKHINHAYEDGNIFSKSMQLDFEVKNLEEVKTRTSQSRLVADASDSIMSEFDNTIRNFKTKLLNAANSSLNSNDYEAIANELEKERDHMINLANTKINGIYIFSGTSTNVKPIDNNGNYYGNNKNLETIISKDIKVPFSINGDELFKGVSKINKTISTNVQLRHQDEDRIISADDKVENLISNSTGDNINFFISGSRGDGTDFKSIKSLNPQSTINDLLESIATSFGNTSTTKFVDVQLSSSGNITVTDIKSGKSNLDLKIVGLQGGNSATETNLSAVTYDNIIKFTKSDFSGVDTTREESLQMDSFYFKKEGATLSSNSPLFSNREFATSRDLLKDIAGGSMNNKTFNLQLTNINGDSKDVTIDLKNSSTFNINGDDYDIFNSDGTDTQADQMTMGQLNNIISMVTSNKLPATNNSFAEFNNAIKDSKKLIDVSLDSESKLVIKDKSNSLTKIEFAIYDKDANDFSTTTTPSISFMSNDLITTNKAQMDFFKDLDKIIQSVRDGKMDVNSIGANPRDSGLQSAIASLDQFSAHFNSKQSKLGAMSKSLSLENEKASAMQLNVKTLKSEVEDVDLAATITKLNQLTLNYQAMLSTISKVNSLSLLNYLK